MRGAIVALVLLLASASASADPTPRRLEAWVLAGGGVTATPHVDERLSKWPLITTGIGYEVSRHVAFEWSATYRYLGRLGLSSLASQGPYPSHESVSLASMVVGPCLMSTRRQAAKGFVSMGAGVYLLRGTYDLKGFEPVSSIRPGLSVAAGAKGPAGSVLPRIDVRLHARAPDRKHDFVYNRWLRTVELSVGAQF